MTWALRRLADVQSSGSGGNIVIIVRRQPRYEGNSSHQKGLSLPAARPRFSVIQNERHLER
jgi:hypothetical protein